MMTETVREPDIPEGLLRLLATPVARSQQTWYLGCRTREVNPRWLLATLWMEHRPDLLGRKPWCISFRGEALGALVHHLVDDLVKLAKELGCCSLLTDALAVGSPFDQLLPDSGFIPFRQYRTVQASTIATLRGVGLGVEGARLKASNWRVGSPVSAQLPLVAAIFEHELNQIPPHLFHLMETPDEAYQIDESMVLFRGEHPVAAIVARRTDRTIDIQGLVCHPRWRSHRAFSWMLAERSAPWPLIADRVVFSFPEANAGMADIARRIDAQVITRRRDLILSIEN